MNERSTILVTGANGCIGSWVLKLCLQRGHDVVAVDLVDKPDRPRLLLDDEALARIAWHAVDITDSESTMSAVVNSKATGVIHLAGLQVPFCKSDPALGARVNVVGTANVMEAVRQTGIKRFAIASSVAALGSARESNAYLGTLYGAYKAATEEMARVYWQDWQVPSVVIRPGVVYGVGRDQGMTSAPTKAILAAAAGRSYRIPFSGRVAFLYAGEVASAFLKSVEHDREGAHAYDLNGECRPMTDLVELIKREQPDADIEIEGPELPFPPDLSDEPLRQYLGEYDRVNLETGVHQTYAMFRHLSSVGSI